MDARRAVLAPKKRSPADALLPVLRFGFRTLSAISPGLAALAAEQLWFTPPRPRLPAASAAFLATGTRSDLRVHGRRVAVWTWGDGPAVLLVHGWGGFGAQLESFVRPLVAQGFRAIAFDAPAHGASGPSRRGRRQATFFDFADVLVELSRTSGPVAGVVAHSGGCTSVAWALRGGWSVPAAVFVAPMASPITYRRVFGDALQIGQAALDRFAANVERTLKFRWEELEIVRVADVTEPPPLLVLHDRDDRETSWRDSVTIAEAWPEATLHTTAGLGHNRILRDAEVVERAVQFIARRTEAEAPVLLQA